MLSLPRRFIVGLGLLVAAGVWPCRAPAEDWPQWRGPRGDGISQETGLLASWPEGGPPVVWRERLGGGFSGIAVAGGRAYTMAAAGDAEYAVCLDAATGKQIWRVKTGEVFESSYGDGPRATPTVDGDRVYALGSTGPLVCLEAATGKQVWGVNVLEQLGGENLEYGLAASPAAFGPMLVVVGGKDGKAVAALDKATGKVLWTGPSELAGYSTPILVKTGGVEQIIVLLGKFVVGLSPKDGREFWRQPWETTLDANVATPIVAGDRLFISTGYGTGCGLFELAAAGGTPVAKPLWATKDMKNYFSTSVLSGGHLYGFDNTVLACMEFATGEIKWRQRGFNRGTVLVADGKLLVLGERGTLALAELSPAKYTEISRFDVFDGKSWTVPTVAGGRLLVRNEEEIACFDLRAAK